MPPSEFWELTPSEAGIFLEYKRPKHVGNLHEDQMLRLRKRREEAEAKGKKVI